MKKEKQSPEEKLEAKKDQINWNRMIRIMKAKGALVQE